MPTSSGRTRGRAWRSSTRSRLTSVVPEGCALLDPALELRDRDQDRLPAAADDPQLRLDVLVEEVAADAQQRRGLIRNHRHPADWQALTGRRLCSGRGELEAELVTDSHRLEDHICH